MRRVGERTRSVRSPSSPIVVAIFVAIVTAATNSTATDSLPLSPSWLVDTAYNAVSNVASGPASAISNAANTTVNGTTQQAISKSDPLSCYWYTQEFVDQYQAAYTRPTATATSCRVAQLAVGTSSHPGLHV